MSLSPTTLVHAPSRRWVDVLLILGGAALLLSPWPLASIPVLMTGATVPLMRWATTRHRQRSRLLALVPPELAAAYQTVVDLADEADDRDLVAGADDMLLEVAAVLGGRAPRGRAQRRLVEVRISILTELASELRQRRAALADSRAEVDALDDVNVSAVDVEEPGGFAARVVMIVLLPFFLVWDLARGTGMVVAAFASGIALRLRTLQQLVVRLARAIDQVVADALGHWRDVRAAIARTLREARGSFVSMRLRIRLFLRRARRQRPRLL